MSLIYSAILPGDCVSPGDYRSVRREPPHNADDPHPHAEHDSVHEAWVALQTDLAVLANLAVLHQLQRVIKELELPDWSWGCDSG